MAAANLSSSKDYHKTRASLLLLYAHYTNAPKRLLHAKLWLVLLTGTACVHQLGKVPPTSRSQSVPHVDSLVPTP
jgi:hypothetical protein